MKRTRRHSSLFCEYFSFLLLGCHFFLFVMNRSDRASGSVRAEDYYYFFLPKKEQKGVDRGGVFVFGELAVFQKKNCIEKRRVECRPDIAPFLFFSVAAVCFFFCLPESKIENSRSRMAAR